MKIALLNKLAYERAQTRSHIIRMAIRTEAGLEDLALERSPRGGWDSARGMGMFSGQEELVLHLRNEGRSPEDIARELRLPPAGVLDILAGIDRKLDFFGDALIPSTRLIRPTRPRSTRPIVSIAPFEPEPGHRQPEPGPGIVALAWARSTRLSSGWSATSS